MVEKLLKTLRDSAWQSIGIIVAMMLFGLPLVLSKTITIFLITLCVLLAGIFIYANNNDSFESLYSLLQIVAGFILGGALITVATILIPLQVIIVLSLVLVTILALLTTHDNLKAYRPFMFSIIAGYVVAISFILNTSISKESFPMILS